MASVKISLIIYFCMFFKISHQTDSLGSVSKNSNFSKNVTSFMRKHGPKSIQPDKAPYVVAITYNDKYLCAGAIVHAPGSNPRFQVVITTAQCITQDIDDLMPGRLRDKKLLTVKAGVVDINEEHELQQDRNVIHITRHPKWSHLSHSNDIAVLHLDENFRNSRFVQPIDLPPIDHVHPSNGEILYVTGYAPVESAESSIFNIHMKQITVPTIAWKDCINIYASKYGNQTNFGQKTLCALKSRGKGHVAPCVRDIGAPAATFWGEDGDFYIAGLFSWREPGCEPANPFPALFTRISSHMKFLRENILPSKGGDNHIESFVRNDL